MILRILENKLCRICLILIGVLSTIIPIIGSYFMAIDVDSAIILTEMERIYEGYIPYKDIHLNYPPLWFYQVPVPWSCRAVLRSQWWSAVRFS